MALTSVIEEYSDRWKDLYILESSALHKVFDQPDIDIHHIGSTAIPSMWAKPEIDILVVAPNLADLKSYISKIESLGYDFRGEEPGAPGHWFFSKNIAGKRTHKLHLCEPSHPCVKEQLLFRDYLRTHPDVAQEYAHLKRDLERVNTRGMAEYLAGKAPFIKNVLSRALAKT